MQVHGVKKDEIQLQMTGGVLERGDSNHSDAKYETSLEGHEMLRNQNHDLTSMVRGSHDHEVLLSVMANHREPIKVEKVLKKVFRMAKFIQKCKENVHLGLGLSVENFTFYFLH